MIGSDVILFPEGGRGFRAALRTAVMYSEKVRVLAPLAPGLSERILELVGPVTIEDPVPAQRVSRYFNFLRDHTAELRDLHREGIVVPVMDDRDLEQSRLLASDRVIDVVHRLKDSPEVIGEIQSSLEAAYHLPSSCLADAEFASAAFRVARGEEDSRRVWEHFGPSTISFVFFIRYLMQVAAAAEQSGFAALSWSPAFQNALWTVRDFFLESPASGGLSGVKRDCTSAMLAQAVMERRLPQIHDLPLHVILEIRRKRKDELESLRVALRALATEVDVSLPIQEIQCMVRDLVASKVDPAVDEVSRSLRAMRLDALKKLGRSSASLAGASFCAAVTIASGAPLNLAALLIALGGTLGAIGESALDRERLVRGSQWGILVRFGKINSVQARRPMPKPTDHEG